jgi:2-keto-4-pentenoate hydratase/2-oxohepta-3-ene-1,7-dioic acid hydratase in catechol pathway
VVLAQARRADSTVGATRPWLVHGRHAAPLASVGDHPAWAHAGSIDDLLAQWYAVAGDLRELTEDARTREEIDRHGLDVAELVVDAPVRPRQAFCTIGNYAGQVVEAAVDAGDGPCGRGAERRRRETRESVDRRRLEGEPYICLTSPHRVSGPRDELGLPPQLDTLDWEVEVAVVIGLGASGTARGDGVVAGYCLANDLTIRSEILRRDVPGLASDWIRSKGMRGSLPLGPWFVPAWQVPDVSALRLQLHLNNELMQDELAGDMIFDVDRQMDYLARHAVLGAGDVLCTGSPAGFGAHYRRFLRPGDRVRASVAELGEQMTTCVEQPADLGEPQLPEPVGRVGGRNLQR